jgi:hypothetical protein
LAVRTTLELPYEALELGHPLPDGRVLRSLGAVWHRGCLPGRFSGAWFEVLQPWEGNRSHALGHHRRAAGHLGRAGDRRRGTWAFPRPHRRSACRCSSLPGCPARTARARRGSLRPPPIRRSAGSGACLLTAREICFCSCLGLRWQYHRAVGQGQRDDLPDAIVSANLRLSRHGTGHGVKRPLAPPLIPRR